MVKEKKKGWREKLHEAKGLPKVEKIEDGMSTRWLAGRSPKGGGRGGGTVAIPAPIEVNELMAKVPEGKVTTINEIREAVAKKHKATIGCPITSGIFAWISAYAAEEDRMDKKKDITPWWRTLKSGGQLNEKYPGGIQKQKRLLTKEGHTIVKKGKKYLVEGYEGKLAVL